jgi:hypothetical protein
MANTQQPLAKKRVAFLATDGVEDIEYTQSRAAVEQAGAEIDLISLHAGEIQAMNEDINPANRYPVDRTVDQANPADYESLVLPGGAVNPDRLRMNTAAMTFVRAFFEEDKPVAAIRGHWSKPGSWTAGGSRLSPACAPISATPAVTGWTNRSWSTTAWSPAAPPTTCRPSAPRWSKSSPRADTQASWHGPDAVRALDGDSRAPVACRTAVRDQPGSPGPTTKRDMCGRRLGPGPSAPVACRTPAWLS